MGNDGVNRKRILVVEDEPDISVYLARVFEGAGFRTRRAADGEEALRAVEQERPDLITLDLSLPGTSGVRVYRTLKSRPDFATIPVIFITGVTGPGGARDAERFYRTQRQVPPPDGFVAKPINPEQVLALATKLLSGARGTRQAEQGAETGAGDQAAAVVS